MKCNYTTKNKMGRSLLKGKTPLLVTHLIQNEKWLNDQIGLFQVVADEAKKAEDIPAYREACNKVADLINQHRLFVADLLPYCLPKLSATMNNDNDEAQKLIAELMEVGKPIDTNKPTDSDYPQDDPKVDAPDADE
jgi:hypothetical protein